MSQSLKPRSPLQIAARGGAALLVLQAIPFVVVTGILNGEIKTSLGFAAVWYLSPSPWLGTLVFAVGLWWGLTRAGTVQQRGQVLALALVAFLIVAILGKALTLPWSAFGSWLLVYGMIIIISGPILVAAIVGFYVLLDPLLKQQAAARKLAMGSA